MKAAILEQPGSLSIINKTIPTPKSNEVLIKVQYCGICSTDVMIYKGIYSKDRLPLIPGHEFIGHIAAIGSDVKKWKVGDYVSADINMGCGCCRYCLENQPLACTSIEQIGIHRDGGFAEYVTVPAIKVVPLKGTADALEYALAEPVSNVVRSIKRSGSLLGRSVLVMGDNFMTLLHIQIAHIAGAWPVTLMTDNPDLSSLARSMGADTVLKAKQIDRKECLSNEGFEFVFETEGTVGSYSNAHQLLAAGGTLIAFGIPPQGGLTQYEPFNLVLKEQSVISSVAASGTDLYDAIGLIESGRLNLKVFTNTILSLNEVEKGLDVMEMDKSIFKVIIEVSK